jgi:hypothetical protein
MSRSGHFPGNFVELDGYLLGTTQFASAESSENATFERCGVIARLHVAFFEAIAPENVAACANVDCQMTIQRRPSTNLSASRATGTDWDLTITDIAD